MTRASRRVPRARPATPPWSPLPSGRGKGAPSVAPIPSPLLDLSGAVPRRAILAAGALAAAGLVTLGGRAAAQAPKPGGRAVVVSAQEPRTLLPHLDLLTLSREVQRLVFDGLLTLDDRGEYVPRLAAEVPTVENGGVSADGRTYTFRLRRDVKWQDGTPLTAADVEFTWRMITDPKVPVPSRVVWADVSRIETPDPHTVRVHFAKPSLAFLATAASDRGYIVPRHLLEGKDVATSELGRRPVGTGPFGVKEWLAGSHVLLARNPGYRDPGRPHLDEILVRIIPGTPGQRAALERQETDLQLHLPTADVASVKGLADYRIIAAPSHAWWHFWLNGDDPILREPEVRRALAHGLDRATIAGTVMAGLVAPLHAALPPAHWAHNPAVRVYAHDPARAAQLLDEAGWKPGPGGVRQKDGKPLALEILNIAGEAERLRVVQLVQAGWRQIGVDARIRMIDGPAFPPTMSKGEFQVAYGWFGEEPEPVFTLWLGTNWQRYRNEAALDLLRQATATPARARRLELIRQFQAQAAEDVPTLPLAPRVLLNVAHTRLRGYAPSVAGSLWNAAEWWKG
jgi:peptide/nickel transport system substrate-binding protein